MQINYSDQLSDQCLFDRKDKRDIAEYWTAESNAGVIATAHYRATRIGAAILADGGNAVDAAVAAALALGVCEPAASGLGGMTMMLIHQAATPKTVVLKGPCRAPRQASPENLQNQSRSSGYQAIAIPTTPAVLDYALSKYGSFSREQVIAPAKELAEAGYPVTQLQYELSLRYRDALAKQNGSRFFLGADGQPAPPGTILRQPVLAATLERLARVGWHDFYQGEIAAKIVADMQRHSGFIDRHDMQNIPWPEESEPLSQMVGEHQICTLGPPGGGIVLLQLLQLFQAAPDYFEPDTPGGVLFLANAIRRARRDRMRHFRVASGVEKGSIPPRLTREYAQAVAEEISAGIASSGETTHISVVDRHGNAVSLTQSIERVFGAKVATADLGFLYNGYLKAFNLKIPNHPHYLQPGAVARSNATPTIVFSGSTPVAVVGCTGSERMVSVIFQVLMRLQRQEPFAAVHAPRLHCTPRGVVKLEANRFSATALQLLGRHGLSVQKYGAYSFKMGGLQLIARHGDKYCGVADPRRDGAAAGPMLPAHMTTT